MKTAWRRDLLDRAYERDIAAARKTKDRERIESLERDRQFELEVYDEEDDAYITERLVKEARRLRVPVPHRFNEDGTESEHWEQGRYFGRAYLTRRGISALREEIRKERKARHEARSHWIAWLSAVTGIVGAATGFIAVWFKTGG
jgi:hypothetical protein